MAACSPARSRSRIRCRRRTRLAFTALANRPEPDRIAMVADRDRGVRALAAMPRRERRIALLMPDYPGAPGRDGYAVGLDVPASVLALLADLARGRLCACATCRQTSRALLDALDAGATDAALSLRRLSPAARRLAGRSAQRDSCGVGRACRRSRCARRRVPLPRARIRQCFGRAAARPRTRRATGAPTITIRRCRRAMRCVAFGLWLRHVAKRRRARAYGRARHARMAARQGGGADGRPASPRRSSARCR